MLGEPPMSPPSDASLEDLLSSLPHHVLLLVLQQLDTVSLCSVARCSRLLHRLSAHPSLWPLVSYQSDWALAGIKLTMADILKLPPQVFHAQLDVRRSRRFPVLVPMHNLRTILGTSDAEGLADRVSRALQERVAHAQHNLWRADSWQQLPPAASISVCRADGASIRAALRPQVVVPRMVHHLQQAGSPPVAAQAATAGVAAGLSTSAGGSSCVTAGTGSSLSCSCSTAADSSPGEACSRCHSTETVGICDRPSSDSAAQLPSGLLSVLHLCQQRMQLLCSQQLSQLQHLYAAKVCNPTMLSQCPRDVGKAAGAHWRPNMAALQAVAGKLPDAAVAREYASSLSSRAASEDPSAGSTAALAVRLFWAGVAADPGLLSYSAAGKAAQWQAPLAQATRVAAKVQALRLACQQQVCQHSTAGSDPLQGMQGLSLEGPSHRQACDSCCSNSSSTWWQRAGQAELQLCQSGLQQFLLAVCATSHPATLLRCVQALETAASEYLVASSQDPVMGFSSFSALSHDTQGQELAVAKAQNEAMRLAMHTEVLRALHWCLWLLGVEGQNGLVCCLPRSL